jgi:hypothetical protein
VTDFPNNMPREENLAQTQVLRIRQGDRLPTLVAQIVDDLGEIIDLTGHTAWLSTRKVQSANGGGNWSNQRQTLIIDYVAGLISYDWQKEDTFTSDPGTYEFNVSIVSDATDEVVVTVPTNRDTFLVVRSQATPDQAPGQAILTWNGLVLTWDQKALTIKEQV